MIRSKASMSPPRALSTHTCSSASAVDSGAPPSRWAASARSVTPSSRSSRSSFCVYNAPPTRLVTGAYCRRVRLVRGEPESTVGGVTPRRHARFHGRAEQSSRGGTGEDYQAGDGSRDGRECVHPARAAHSGQVGVSDGDECAASLDGHADSQGLGRRDVQVAFCDVWSERGGWRFEQSGGDVQCNTGPFGVGRHGRVAGRYAGLPAAGKLSQLGELCGERTPALAGGVQPVARTQKNGLEVAPERDGPVGRVFLLDRPERLFFALFVRPSAGKLLLEEGFTVCVCALRGEALGVQTGRTASVPLRDFGEANRQLVLRSFPCCPNLVALSLIFDANLPAIRVRECGRHTAPGRCFDAVAPVHER